MPSLVEIGPVVLEKKMKMWKVYRQTDRQTDRRTDDGRHVIRKAHLSFQLRWAKNTLPKNKILLLQNHSANFNLPWHKAYLDEDQFFNFVQMKGHALFQGEIFTKSPEPLGQFQPDLAQNILGWREFKFVQIRNHSILKKKKMDIFLLIFMTQSYVFSFLRWVMWSMGLLFN